MTVGKSRSQASVIYGRGLGVINSDQETTLLFDEDAEIVEESLIGDTELEGTMTQSKALKITLNGDEYFIPLIEDGA